MATRNSQQYNHISNSNFYNDYQKRKSVNPDESLDLYASLNNSRVSHTPKMNFDPNESHMNSFTMSPIRQPGNPQVWNQNQHDDSMNDSMFNSPHFNQDPRFSNNNQRVSNNNQRISNQRVSNNYVRNSVQQQRPSYQQGANNNGQQRITHYNPKRNDFQNRLTQNTLGSDQNLQHKHSTGNLHNPSYNINQQQQQWKKVDNQPFEIMDLYSQESQRNNQLEVEKGGFYRDQYQQQPNPVQQQGDMGFDQGFVKKSEYGYASPGRRMENYADLDKLEEGGGNVPRTSVGFCGKDECILI